MKSILVIADLHLSPDRNDISQCFYQFLIDNQHQHDTLYILGDLFEVWVGDEDESPFVNDIAKAIHNFSKHTPVYFIHGNRDFMLGKRYAQKAGMTLLPESHLVEYFGHKVLFMHGDQLCLDDIEYQKFRRISRSWLWHAFFKLVPTSYKRKLAKKIRAKSKQQQQYKSLEIMDVAVREVERVMAESNCELLIHGHTHRPNIHHLQNNKQRVVVGDWYQQGSVLTLTSDGAKLSQLPFEKQ